MPPKNKGKKGRKQGDDDFWYEDHLVSSSVLVNPLIREDAGTSVAGNNYATNEDDGDDYAPQTKSKPGFSAFAALGLEEPAAEEEEEDFGGLMVRIS